MEGKSVGIETASESDLNEAENQNEFRPNLKLENLKNENIWGDTYPKILRLDKKVRKIHPL